MQTLRFRDNEIIPSSDDENKRTDFTKNPFRNNKSQLNLQPVRSVLYLKNEVLTERYLSNHGTINAKSPKSKANQS